MTDFISLTARQATLVEQAAARIFPTTDTPGATEAGAVTYIDRALAEAYPHLASLYRAGCRALDRHSRLRFGKRFSTLAASEQDTVLSEFDRGSVPDFPRAKLFFDTLRSHTMEGVFGEPAYGGNQGLVGWRLVGFPGHQFGYPDPYINREIDLEPVALDRVYATEEEWNEHAR